LPWRGLLLVGYFEGIDSERGIAWRAGDSLSIREFVGIPLDEGAPDHTTIARTRRLIDRITNVTARVTMRPPLGLKLSLRGRTVRVEGKRTAVRFLSYTLLTAPVSETSKGGTGGKGI